MQMHWGLAALLFLAASPQGDLSLAPPNTAEFPLADFRQVSAYQHWRQTEILERRLKTARTEPETVRLLMSAQRYDEALEILREVVNSAPAKMAALFDAMLAGNGRAMITDKARNHADVLRGIVAEARRALPLLTREEQAEIARSLVSVDTELSGERDSWRRRLSEFAQTYRGTGAALLTEVDLLTDRVGPQMLQSLDAFIHAHQGTEAAAKALYLKGFHLSHNGFSFGERAGADPTDRFFRVLEISRELQNGKYPVSEWVEKGRKLPVEFFSYRPKYGPGNAERILAVLERLLPDLLREFDEDPSKDSIKFVINSRMGELYMAVGKGITDVERLYDRLASDTSHRHAALLLKAEMYLRPPDRVVDAKEWPSLRKKAFAPLNELVRTASGFPKRKALATLATLEFADGQFEQAVRHYREYAEAYSDSPYAWVAALRVAKCEEARGRVAEAAAIARAAAERYQAILPARVLGYAEAARLSESAGDFEAALNSYKVAAAAWKEDPRRDYSLEPSRPAAPERSFDLPQPDVTLPRLETRVAELTSALAAPGGALVERARWSIGRQRWAEALAELKAFFTNHPTSSLASEAERLRVRARLEAALDLADADSDRPDHKTALEQLESISPSAPSFDACAVGIARAILTYHSAPIEGESVMADAMKCWKALDRDPGSAAPRSALERDVVEIRNVVFRPRGGAFYEGARFDSYRWEAGPYQVASPDLRVKLHDRTIRTIRVMDPFPELDSVVFLDAARRALLERLMGKLGGTKRREPTHIMQVPNQPAGSTHSVRSLWTRFFFVQPGHWGGWVFETYPIINEIEFADAARTKAAVKVTVGYSGATVHIEKKDDVWVVRELSDFWIT